MQREVRVHSRHLGCAASSVRRVALPAMATSVPASPGTPYREMDTPAWPMVSTATPHNIYDGSEKSGSSYILQWCSQGTAIDMSGHTVFVRTSVQSAAASIQGCEGHAAPGGFWILSPADQFWDYFRSIILLSSIALPIMPFIRICTCSIRLHHLWQTCIKWEHTRPHHCVDNIALFNFRTIHVFIVPNLSLTMVVPALIIHRCTRTSVALVAGWCAHVCPSLGMPLMYTYVSWNWAKLARFCLLTQHQLQQDCFNKGWQD